MVHSNNFGVVKIFIHISFPWPFHYLGVFNAAQRKKKLFRGYMMSYYNGIYSTSEGGLVTSFSQNPQGKVVHQDWKSAIKNEIIYLR